MKSLLEEIKSPDADSGNLSPSQSNALVLEGDTGDLEQGRSQGGKKGKFMEDYFKKIESLQQLIEYIKLATNKIVDLRENAAKAIGKEAEEECSKALEEVIKETNGRCNVGKKTLKEMKTETDELISSKKLKQSELRIRRNLHATHTQKFVEVLREYQKAQQSYKLKMKEKITRHVKTVKPNATEDEINKVIEMGDATAVFQSAILSGQVDPVANAYLNAVDKYQDVIRLEKSIVELHQMFVDMAVLVEQQGEMIDNIEHSVNTAEEYVEKGNRELVRANKARRAMRKKYFLLALIFGVVLVIIVVPSITN